MNRKQLNKMFDIMLKMLGKERGYEIGQWNLDYNSCYHGYMIVEYMENGGEHHPLLNKRLKASEMGIAIEMAIALKRGE